MKRLVWLFVLFPLLVYGGEVRISELTEVTNTGIESTDLFLVTIDPGTTPASRKLTLGNYLLWMATQDVTWSGTWTGNIVGNASTASALASNPTDCSSNQFANAIAANGNLTCAALTDADVPDTITASSYLPLAGGTLTGAVVNSKVNAASGSADVLTLSGTLGIMNGSDTFRGIYLNYTNANHTGSSNAVSGIFISSITADAEATETGIYIESGWDVGIQTASPVKIIGDGSTTKGDLKLYDLDNSAYVAITPADETTSWTMTLPAAAPTIDGALKITGTDGVEEWLSSVDGCFVSGGTDGIIRCKSSQDAWDVLSDYLASGVITDEQLACWETTAGHTQLKSCGSKVTDESTASHAVYKDSDSKMQNQVLTIDAHAASTTITLIPGICPIIHNASQADSNINNTLPAVGAGLCFVALATSAEADKYWRLTAASANTVCLNRTCGKDYIQFDTPAVGDTFTCMSDGTNWYCYDRDSDATVGDL